MCAVFLLLYRRQSVAAYGELFFRYVCTFMYMGIVQSNDYIMFLSTAFLVTSVDFRDCHSNQQSGIDSSQISDFSVVETTQVLLTRIPFLYSCTRGEYWNAGSQTDALDFKKRPRCATTYHCTYLSVYYVGYHSEGHMMWIQPLSPRNNDKENTTTTEAIK